MDAKVGDVFFGAASENPHYRKKLSKNPEHPFLLNRSTLMQVYNRNVKAEITFSLDDQDGAKYSLVIGLFVDGDEVQYVTDWLYNTAKHRTLVYQLPMPQYSYYYNMQEPHTVQVKIGYRKIMQPLQKREYNLGESPVYYYQVTTEE